MSSKAAKGKPGPRKSIHGDPMIPPKGGMAARCFLGIFCIVAGIVCGYLMDIPAMINDYPEPSATGFIEWEGGKIRILERFHWIPFLDTVFRNVTVGFAPSAFGYDDVSRWMMRPFMLDMGVWYMIWLLESTRDGNKGTVAAIPAFWALIAQIAGGGVFVPIYYGLFLIFTTPIGQQTPLQRKVKVKDAWYYFCLLFIFDYGPIVGMLYHPTLDGRHYWTWFWQLYSVRMTIAYYIVSSFFSLLPYPRLVSQRLSYRTTIVLIFTPLIAISAASWIYTLALCAYPISDVFWPHAFTTDTWVNRLRRILQLDYNFLNGVGLLWASALLKDAGMTGLGASMKIAIIAVSATACFGPAAAMGILWVWRELSLVGAGDFYSEGVFRPEAKEKKR